MVFTKFPMKNKPSTEFFSLRSGHWSIQYDSIWFPPWCWANIMFCFNFSIRLNNSSEKKEKEQRQRRRNWKKKSGYKRNRICSSRGRCRRCHFIVTLTFERYVFCFVDDYSWLRSMAQFRFLVEGKGGIAILHKSMMMAHWTTPSVWRPTSDVYSAV